MRCAGKSAILAAALGALLLVAAAPAGAKVARVASMTLHGTNGYRIRFIAQGRGSSLFTQKAEALREDAVRRAEGPARHDLNVIRVEVDRHRSPMFVDYLDTSSDRHFTPRGFAGSFGKLGVVDVRLHTRNRTTTRFPGCPGGIVQRSGFFTGTIRFRGEHGYTSVDARRARGRITAARHPRHCRLRLGHKATANAVLHARKRSRHGRFITDLQAFGTKQQPELGFAVAGRSELKQDYSVFRALLLLTRKPILTFRRDLSRARLHAPAHSRLQGTARFVAPGRWTGPLSVALPGRPHIRLTGPGFHVRLHPDAH